MIIVFGNVQVAPHHMNEARKLAKEHVERSRTEPGCISHNVYEDPDRPNLLVFVEEWSDPATLAAHFAVPASQAFVHEVTALAETPPVLRMFEATPLSL